MLSRFFLFLIGITIFPLFVEAALSYNNSAYGTTNYNQELVAIEEAKVLAKEWSKETHKRKPLLCVVFTSSLSHHNKIMSRNMSLTRGICEWAVILYKGEESEICLKKKVMKSSALCKRNAESRIEKTREFQGEVLPITTTKPVLVLDILPIIRNYEKVVLLDEDISLEGFSFSRFFKAWNCVTKYPPLISQPLIYESKQYFSWVNRKTWYGKELKNVIANDASFIEQQVPIFDAKFFEWFMKSILIPLRPTVLATGSCWGQDNIWCGAAQTFSEKILGYPSDTSACMFFPRSGSIHHLDGKSIDKKGNNKAFFDSGMTLVQTFINTFPVWTVSNTTTANPFTKEGKERFKRYEIKDIQGKCSPDIFDPVSI